MSPKRQKYFSIVSNNVQEVSEVLSAFTSLYNRKLWVKVSTVSFESSTSSITIIDLVLKELICQVRILFLAFLPCQCFNKINFNSNKKSIQLSPKVTHHYSNTFLFINSDLHIHLVLPQPENLVLLAISI